MAEIQAKITTGPASQISCERRSGDPRNVLGRRIFFDMLPECERALVRQKFREIKLEKEEKAREKIERDMLEVPGVFAEKIDWPRELQRLDLIDLEWF